MTRELDIARVSNTLTSIDIYLPEDSIPDWAAENGIAIHDVAWTGRKEDPIYILCRAGNRSDGRKISKGSLARGKGERIFSFATASHSSKLGDAPKFGLSAAKVLNQEKDAFVVKVDHPLPFVERHRRLPADKAHPKQSRLCHKDVRAVVDAVNALQAQHSDLILRINDAGRLEAVAAVIIGG